MRKNILLFIPAIAIHFTFLIGFAQENRMELGIRNSGIGVIHNLNVIDTYKDTFNRNVIFSLDSVEVKIIYSKGKLPIKRWVPDTLSINLKKNIPGLFPIKLRIKIKNTYDNSIIYDSNIVITQFNVFDTIISRQLPKLNQIQSDLIIVDALPGKVLDNMENIFFFDSKQYCQDITIDEYNFADPCLADDGGVGFEGVTGNIVAGFSNYDTTSFIINKVNHCFFDTLGGGGHPYNIVIYSDNGNWQPGALLYISPLLYTPPGTGSEQNVTHILSLPLTIPPNSRFYVGYKQTSGDNIAACYQNEIPVRSKSFFFSIPETSSSWFDFSNFGNNFRLDISPSSDSGNLNLSVIQQGLYNSFTDNLNLSDTVKVYLRNAALPFTLVDSAKGILDSVTFSKNYSFCKSYTGSYYAVVKYRNCIETWSKIPFFYVSGGQVYYDFKSSATNAFGDNQIQVNTAPSRYAVYSGDANQDGKTDLTDIILIYSDMINFTFGYIPSDLNGDYIANLFDLLICLNNTVNFIEKISP